MLDWIVNEITFADVAHFSYNVSLHHVFTFYIYCTEWQSFGILYQHCVMRWPLLLEESCRESPGSSACSNLFRCSRFTTFPSVKWIILTCATSSSQLSLSIIEHKLQGILGLHASTCLNFPPSLPQGYEDIPVHGIKWSFGQFNLINFKSCPKGNNRFLQIF